MREGGGGSKREGGDREREREGDKRTEQERIVRSTGAGAARHQSILPGHGHGQPLAAYPTRSRPFLTAKTVKSRVWRSRSAVMGINCLYMYASRLYAAGN